MKLKTWGAAGLALLIQLGLIIFFLPNLRAKLAAESKDKNVSFEIDLLDIEAFSLKENKSVGQLLPKLKEIPATVIALDGWATSEIEQTIRAEGFKILWRSQQTLETSPWPVLNRMKNGDGILGYENTALGFPMFLDEVVTVLMMTDGFMPLVEFATQDGLPIIANKLPRQMIKTHCLQAREVIHPNLNLWEYRILRAVKGRWVRHLQIHFSPGLTFAQNLAFQKGVADKLRSSGFTVGEVSSRGALFDPFQNSSIRWLKFLRLREGLIVLFSVLTPLLGLWFLKNESFKFPLMGFLIVCGFSLVTGALIHAMGSDPLLIAGIRQVPGIKIELIFPLFLAFILLLNREEIKSIFKSNVTVGQIGIIGLLIILIGGIYVMRSGNHSIIPVWDGERHLRDWLETFFGARPRFKEFLIGHPFMLWGLWQRNSHQGLPCFTKDGRLWMALGIVGQISIINSFHHFHSIFAAEILRSFHGIWLGMALGLGWIWLARTWKEQHS